MDQELIAILRVLATFVLLRVCRLVCNTNTNLSCKLLTSVYYILHTNYKSTYVSA